jgi:hypothetical protein
MYARRQNACHMKASSTVDGVDRLRRAHRHTEYEVENEWDCDAVGTCNRTAETVPITSAAVRFDCV